MQGSNSRSRIVCWTQAIRATFSRGSRLQRKVASLPKKILYFHVAKAGGSTFNQVLHSHLHGEAHCEQYVEVVSGSDGKQRKTLGNLEYLKSLDYISGHLTYPLLQDSDFDFDDYFVVTILRHPFAQTLSHLNWVIKISEDERSELYRNVAPGVQLMSKTLRGVEEWTPPILFHWLEKYPGWFKDNQSRYFVRADELSAATVIDVLSRLNLVGVTERIDQFVRQFQDLTGTIPSSRSLPLPRENRNPAYRVPLSLLDDPVVDRYLSKYNSIDMAVYAHVDQTLAP